MNRRARSKYLRIAAALVVTVIVGFVLVRTLRAEGPAALDAFRRSTVDWRWITLACLVGFIGHAVSIMGWRRLLFDVGIRLSLRENIRMFFIGNLGRYLPAGRAWQMGIVSTMAAERGFPPAQLAATSLLQGMVGVVIGALLVFLLGGTLLGYSRGLIVVPVAGIALLLLLPRMIRSSTRLRALLKERMPGFESMSVLSMGTLILASTLSWALWGVALYLLARGLIGDRAESVLTYIVAWTGSMLAGVIAVVAPAGIGVRDAAMQLILSRSGLASSTALIVVVVARVWSTLMEVVPAALMLAVGRARSRRMHPRGAASAKAV